MHSFIDHLPDEPGY